MEHQFHLKGVYVLGSSKTTELLHILRLCRFKFHASTPKCHNILLNRLLYPKLGCLNKRPYLINQMVTATFYFSFHHRYASAMSNNIFSKIYFKKFVNNILLVKVVMMERAISVVCYICHYMSWHTCPSCRHRSGQMCGQGAIATMNHIVVGTGVAKGVGRGQQLN